MVIIFPCSSKAQDYTDAIGVRLSYGGLVSYKHGLNESNYIESILAIRWGGIEVTGLFEWQKAFAEKEQFDWFVGAGMHLGLHGRNNVFNPEQNSNNIVQINLGIDAIGGVEYVFENIPLVVSVDYNPSISFTGERWFIPEGFGISARYILKQ